MAQGAPVAASRAHLDADADGRVLGPEMITPPAQGFRPGGFQRVVKVIEYRMGLAVLINQPVQPLPGVLDGAGGRSGRYGHGWRLAWVWTGWAV